MRTFEQFIGRRKIQNVNNWLKGMNITTEEQLKAWCAEWMNLSCEGGV